MNNQITISVAGSGKTRELVEYCATLPKERNVLVVTFTQANQAELRRRLSQAIGDHPSIEVIGWYSFLIREFAKPFVPFKFFGNRILGFNFEGRPNRFAKGEARFFDSHGAVYAQELGRLSNELIEESNGALMHRLECCYDEILVDEVQDLSAHDWEIVDALLESRIGIKMVGDLRQAVLSTSPYSQKNKQYAHADAIKWVRDREEKGLLECTENNTTWRCRQEIAAFSDTIFDSSWSFPQTKSCNFIETGHDGVFLVESSHVHEYVQRYGPQALRNGKATKDPHSLGCINFGVSKGMEFERVIILPTGPIEKFVKSLINLEPISASKLYVGVTRAKQSVAIIMDDHGDSTLPVWKPNG